MQQRLQNLTLSNFIIILFFRDYQWTSMLYVQCYIYIYFCFLSTTVYVYTRCVLLSLQTQLLFKKAVFQS